MTEEMLNARRAIESLRAGVPNRDAVRELPPSQPNVEAGFRKLLEEVKVADGDSPRSPGMVLEGGFGTGKSHWLEYLRHLALEQGFVCSAVAVSKETPLSDLVKLYRACVECAETGKPEPTLDEVGQSYRSDRAPGYRELYDWVHDTEGLDPRIPATFTLFTSTRDAELKHKILAEWIGEPMRTQDLRHALRNHDLSGRYQIRPPRRDQMLERFEFMSRLFRSAGYAGWLLLCDETEVIQTYVVRQRGRTYAHLAQLLGVAGRSVPGLGAVFAISDDYIPKVLGPDGKHDLAQVPVELAGTRDEGLVPCAQAGMDALQRERVVLIPLERDKVEEVYLKVRALYSRAYPWQAPEIDSVRAFGSARRMREYVRSWINTWDLRRLYDVEADLALKPVSFAYDEDEGLQAGDDGDSAKEREAPDLR